MTFLNSILLAALGAVLIPLIIHILSRRRLKTIDFSSLQFLLQMQRSRLRWLKIREILLLILRMAILALIIFAFARPALTSKRPAGHAPASAAILIDNSLSTERLSSGGILYDDMRRAAAKVIETLRTGDEVWIITIAGSPSLAGPFTDFGKARDALYDTRPEPGWPAIAEGLKRAEKLLLEQANFNRELYLVSDLQDGPWWTFQIERSNEPPIDYFVIAPKEEFENIGLTRVNFPPRILAAGEPFEIRVEVKNYGRRSFENRLVGLHVDNARRAQGTVNLRPQGTSEAVFSLVLDRAGRHTAFVELEDDDYALDNRHYFELSLPDSIAVLAVAQSIADLEQLTLCFAKTGIAHIKYKGITTPELPRYNLSAYQVVILNNIASLGMANLVAIEDFLAKGGGLWLLLGSQSQPESYRQFLRDKAKVDIGPLSVAGASDPQAYFEWNDFDVGHPIFAIYGPENPEGLVTPKLKLRRFYQLLAEIPLAKTADGKVVMASSPDGRIVVMGTDLSLNGSDIALHSFVVPFVIRTVEYLAASPERGQQSWVAGQPATIPLPSTGSAATVTLVGTGGDQIIPVHRGAYGDFITLNRCPYPGLYAITNAEDTLAIVPVNSDTTESVVSTISDERLHQLLGKNVVIVDDPKQIPTAVTQARFGFELWRYFLAAALILLVAESLLAGWKIDPS